MKTTYSQYIRATTERHYVRTVQITSILDCSQRPDLKRSMLLDTWLLEAQDRTGRFDHQQERVIVQSLIEDYWKYFIHSGTRSIYENKKYVYTHAVSSYKIYRKWIHLRVRQWVTTDGSSPNSSDNSSVHFPSSNANHDDPTRAKTPNIQVSRDSGTRGLFHGVEPMWIRSPREEWGSNGGFKLYNERYPENFHASEKNNAERSGSITVSLKGAKRVRVPSFNAIFNYK